MTTASCPALGRVRTLRPADSRLCGGQCGLQVHTSCWYGERHWHGVVTVIIMGGAATVAVRGQVCQILCTVHDFSAGDEGRLTVRDSTQPE